MTRHGPRISFADSSLVQGHELFFTPDLKTHPRRGGAAAEVREPAPNLIQGPCCTAPRDSVVINWPTTGYKLHATGQCCYNALRTTYYVLIGRARGIAPTCRLLAPQPV